MTCTYPILCLLDQLIRKAVINKSAGAFITFWSGLGTAHILGEITQVLKFESHAKELVLLFQGFYLLIFGSHFLLQKHQHLKRPQSVLRDVVGKLQLFEREMEGSKRLQRCVNDDNDIKGSLTCISLLIINIHHPSASMHSVRASVNVPRSCRNCSFRAHISAAISSRSYLARLAFTVFGVNIYSTFRVVRVFTSVLKLHDFNFNICS